MISKFEAEEGCAYFVRTTIKTGNNREGLQSRGTTIERGYNREREIKDSFFSFSGLRGGI